MGIVATPLHEPEIEDIILFYETLMVYGDIRSNDILPDEIEIHKSQAFRRRALPESNLLNYVL
jgi:hypothetical protein